MTGTACFEVLEGDALSVLPTLDSESVHCCVTSPPYFGLRDYGIPPTEWPDTRYAPMPGLPEVEVPAMSCCLGLEPTPEAFVAHLVLLFEEVRRVLRKDATLWLNFGDSFSHGGNGSRDAERWPKQSRNDHRVEHAKKLTGLKPKDLVGMPWRVAFALQAAGWYLRSDVIWSKPNPMPESVTDRPTKAHEYLFLLAKSPRYYFDAEAVREADHGTDHPRNVLDQPEPSGGLLPAHRGIRKADGRNGAGRNVRSVWTITTTPFPDAHFATFPPALVEPCIKAGTSERGVCPECGAPWERVVEEERIRLRPRKLETYATAAYSTPQGGYCGTLTTNTTGWRPTCDHDAEPVPATVFDPCTGSGTTGEVSLKLGRSFRGVEISPTYAAMARDRIGAFSLDYAAERRREFVSPAGPLFEEPDV